MAETYVLDTSLLLGGKDPPPGRPWVTTPEAAAEVSPGGRDHRRFAMWQAAGLQVVAADGAAVTLVEHAAQAAGNWSRLSPADVSLAALALGLGERATLVTDDYTLLDVARRLGIRTATVNTAGIGGTLSFRPRCSGCGRWFDAPQKRDECPVCGSPVKDKPWKGDGVQGARAPPPSPSKHVAAGGTPPASPAGAAAAPPPAAPASGARPQQAAPVPRPDGRRDPGGRS